MLSVFVEGPLETALMKDQNHVCFDIQDLKGYIRPEHILQFLSLTLSVEIYLREFVCCNLAEK